MPSAPIALWELEDITKRFGVVVANDHVSLRLYGGQIHGLLGENGSGKSTLIKTLSGAHPPDGGRILRSGAPVSLPDPIAARRAGIATVFQEFSLVPTLSVAENVYLGRLPLRGGRQVDWKRMRGDARRVLSAMDVELDGDAVVGSLSVANQQLVEIAKALAADATMIVLDEPTAALGIDEIARLHTLLRRLRDQGRAILYISHRLDEVVDLVDVVTILKNGRVASSAEQSRVELSYIVQSMVGDVGEHYPKERNARDQVLFRAEHLATANRVRDVSFEVHRGEVFGLGGVLGSGRTEVARAIFGVDRLTAGSMTLGDRPYQPAGPPQAIHAGVALVPENRKADGLFFNFTGFPNITIARLGKLGRRGTIRLRVEREAGRRLVHDLDITATAEHRLAGALSGGNQQKLVVGRWLFAEAELFVLDEPTQGIDIGAKIAVYRLINRLTAAGKGVILISADANELLAISDRVGIMSHGRLVGILRPQELDTTSLVRASAGAAARKETVA
jgi:ribose transport system ATP-binding protein